MMIDFKYVDFNEIKDTDQVPTIAPDHMDRGAWERLFHSIPQEQLEVLVCQLLGMEPLETVEALQFPNIVHFYNVNAKLKTTYRKQKEQFLGYN